MARTKIPVVKQAARDLRAEPTPSEQQLWASIRGSRLAGLKFRRQHPIGRFVIDFHCPEKRLAVEVDGGIHAGQESADEERQRIVEAMGIRFVRLPAAQVEADLTLGTRGDPTRSVFRTPLPSSGRGVARRAG